MKKVILIFFLLGISTSIKAKTYYSSYSEYEETNNLMEESDLITTRQEDRYLIYKQNVIEEYYPSYMQIDNMIQTDETKTIISDWLEEKPEELMARKIIEKSFYKYADVDNIKYIRFKDIINTNNIIGVFKIQIYDNNEKIDFVIECTDCQSQELYKVKNTNERDIIFFKGGVEFTIILNKEIPIQNLRIVYGFYSSKNTNIYIQTEFLGNEKDNIYFYHNLGDYLNINQSNYYTYELFNYQFIIRDPTYTVKWSEKEPEIIPYRQIKSVKKYQTEDTYIKYIGYLKEYLDDYYIEPINSYQLDLDTKKTFYYFKRRDKVEIKDKMIIDNYDMKLEDFILNSTVSDIKITSNINYLRNGKYDINFITPFKIIKDEVIVDIKENYLNTIKELNKNLKILKLESQDLFIKNNNLQQSLKEVLINTDNKINETNEKLIKYKHENQKLKENKIVFEEEKRNINIKEYLIVFIIIISVVGLIIRKKSI